MMLCFKAWCESRARFVVAVALVISASLAFTLAEATFRSRMIAVGGPALDYVQYIDARVFTGVTRALFLVLAAILGLGGLARERARGTFAFTLALPVRRSQHVFARASVGVGQLAVLAIVPVVIVPACSLLVGETYSVGTALLHAVDWLGAGSAVLAIAMLVAVILRNGYAALIVAVVGLRLAARFLPHEALTGMLTAIVAFTLAAWIERTSR
jgi:ABC-2 type transport system permease protein